MIAIRSVLFLSKNTVPSNSINFSLSYQACCKTACYFPVIPQLYKYFSNVYVSLIIAYQKVLTYKYLLSNLTNLSLHPYYYRNKHIFMDKVFFEH